MDNQQWTVRRSIPSSAGYPRGGPVKIEPLVRAAIFRLRGATNSEFRVDLDLGEARVRAKPEAIALAIDELCLNALLVAGKRGLIDLQAGTSNLEGCTPNPRSFVWIEIRVIRDPWNMGPTGPADASPPRLRPRVAGLEAGLGVAIEAARQAGGVLRVLTRSPAPYHARLIFPLATPEVTRPALRPRRGTPLRGMCLLLAEDDDLVREAFGLRLERAGGTLIHAVDGNDAVHRFAEHSQVVAAALLDVRMPYADGLQALSALRALDPDLPIVFLSGGLPPGCALPLDRRTDYVDKWAGGSELENALTRMVGGGRTEVLRAD